MKNRISSIMDTKRKKTGIAIFCIALAGIMMAGATIAYAATDSSISSIIGMTDNKTGLTKTSLDGGKTWTDKEESRASDIVWWTYDEYKAWLEQEKINLQSLVNARGWSQERIDNAIQRYEHQLELIKNGVKFSKSVDDNNSIGYGDGDLNPTNSTSATDGAIRIINPSAPPSARYSAVFSLENGDTKDLGSYSTKEECFEVVKAFCDEQVKAGKMTQQEADGILSEFK